MAVTGLFQTPEYAYEVLKAGRRPEEIQDLVTERVKRQEILALEDPPQIVTVFDEAVIRRAVGSKEIMSNQYRRLAEIAAMPKVTLQFVASTKGAYAGMMGAFTLLESGDGRDSQPNL